MGEGEDEGDFKRLTTHDSRYFLDKPLCRVAAQYEHENDGPNEPSQQLVFPDGYYPYPSFPNVSVGNPCLFIILWTPDRNIQG